MPLQQLGGLAPWSKHANALNHIDHVTLKRPCAKEAPTLVLLPGVVVEYALHVCLRTSLAHLAVTSAKPTSRDARRSRVDAYAVTEYIVHRRFSEFYRLCAELTRVVLACETSCVYCYQMLSVLDDTLFPHRGPYWVTLRQAQLEAWLTTILSVARAHPGQFESRCHGFCTVMRLLVTFLAIPDL
ncbi:hypothetical protein SPRG_03024 [Saprolegnia parasitica CBS 223.65]|uniref:PX domain-containing protein n=1 Tax=Saprolegnia parasitica (strain CBS 223.65) TaxID=695850 RepID=A0A067CPC0_SAPPC|nr:hypothetical protein SPRG_03024 [Saprolegnia parasitica CBS 223.65]KDO32549.1 hypothetical protein SPRG_03024 [Saprolegnia parasitica CBS 223.65]|eukprot:XP_012196995.1 hypothetical protein SPRG_03024 [Saprolegnia parasitica CBS 223.65]